ncbi:MAG: F0F1 ATP synthase subunit delta [Treponema sp.]|jgi:F-type H+-transporting ATPase subunit delta|nr:F0F1 ATP synthase subunit delta [Treponema sp.]
MFSGERWATGFAGSCGVHTEVGFGALKALMPLISAIPGTLAGTHAAKELEGMIRKALNHVSSESDLSDVGVEYAVRILLLLVKKGYLSHAPELMSALETLLDRQKGILRVTVESAFPVEASFQHRLEAALAGSHTRASHTAVKEIKVMVQIVPELLGGYRLRIGSGLIDASLRTQLQQLAQDLHAAPRETAAGGGFSW